VTDLLGDVEVFVSVGEVERRLFEEVVDDTGEVGEQLTVGSGRCDQQETLRRGAREMFVSRLRCTHVTAPTQAVISTCRPMPTGST